MTPQNVRAARTARGECRTGHTKGFATVSLLALALPALILVGALARSFQSSTARRFVGSAWMHYVGLETAEGAVAEAAHFLRTSDLFDPAIFGAATSGDDGAPGAAVTPGLDPWQRAFDGTPDPSAASTASTTDASVPGSLAASRHGRLSRQLLALMVSDSLPGLAPELREYREILGDDGRVACRMLVAFRFPPRDVVVEVAGEGLKVAASNPGVHTDGRDDLVVHARPLSFRREYYSASNGVPVGKWVGWGVVQFKVRVRTDDLRGTTTQELTVDRRFTLKSGQRNHHRRGRDRDRNGGLPAGSIGEGDGAPAQGGQSIRGGEEVVVSNRDLRTTVREVHS